MVPVCLLTALWAACFAGCAPQTTLVKAELLENNADCVVIAAGKNDALYSLYDALSAFRDAGELTFAGSEGEFGFYLTSLNGREMAADRYWAVYTTLGMLDGTAYSDAAWGTWEYGESSLASASYGVSGLPLVEGELYALVWETYAS